MSDTSGGPGWWQASDGKWYPPEQQPGYTQDNPPPTPAPQPGPGAGPPPAAGLGPPPGFGQAPTGQGPQGYGQPGYGAPGQPGYGAPGQAAYGAGPGGVAPKPGMSKTAKGCLIAALVAVVLGALLCAGIWFLSGDLREDGVPVPTGDYSATVMRCELVDGDVFIEGSVSYDGSEDLPDSRIFIVAEGNSQEVVGRDDLGELLTGDTETFSFRVDGDGFAVSPDCRVQKLTIPFTN